MSCCIFYLHLIDKDLLDDGWDSQSDPQLQDQSWSDQGTKIQKKKFNKRNNVCEGGLGSDLVATGPLMWAN